MPFGWLLLWLIDGVISGTSGSANTTLFTYLTVFNETVHNSDGGKDSTALQIDNLDTLIQSGRGCESMTATFTSYVIDHAENCAIICVGFGWCDQFFVGIVNGHLLCVPHSTLSSSPCTFEDNADWNYHQSLCVDENDSECDAVHDCLVSLTSPCCDCGGGDQTEPQLTLGSTSEDIQYLIPNDDEWECVQSGCEFSDYQQGTDWDYYSETNGDCNFCAYQCKMDNNCRAFECGSSYCAWWSDYSCTSSLTTASYDTCWKRKSMSGAPLCPETKTTELWNRDACSQELWDSGSSSACDCILSDQPVGFDCMISQSDNDTVANLYADCLTKQSTSSEDTELIQTLSVLFALIITLSACIFLSYVPQLAKQCEPEKESCVWDEKNLKIWKGLPEDEDCQTIDLKSASTTAVKDTDTRGTEGPTAQTDAVDCGGRDLSLL